MNPGLIKQDFGSSLAFGDGFLVVVDGLVTDAKGKLTVPFDWPGGVAPGLELVCQAWIADPTAPQGVGGSNGLQGLSP